MGAGFPSMGDDAARQVIILSGAAEGAVEW